MVQPSSNGAALDAKPAPKRVWSVKEPPFEGVRPVDTEGYKRSSSSTAIVIDNGMEAPPTFLSLRRTRDSVERF